MIDPPNYFEAARAAAEDLWVQLETNPVIAAPWHQLFKQVQSPRHVLSELLQNADDAQATEATVCLENNDFVFTHNGSDFSEEQFVSLCRFGYSNKRALHTIGFRGIGFKSTFSLGDVVELYTPTLSVAFRRERFTEPKWIRSPETPRNLTCIRVAIKDEHREMEARKNLEQWLRSPLSLLFFRHIRRIHIGDREVHWKRLGPGPLPETERMALSEDCRREFLLAVSRAEPFPQEALEEIKQERLLPDDLGAEFPPSQVAIVLGAAGNLFVVLPTGVTTSLPFACNAPFIQDPARIKIKDPEISPTNRWLLERAGKLAASLMLDWVKREELGIGERTRAYSLLPQVTQGSDSLEGSCAAIVEKVFATTISKQAFLLTNAGKLTVENESVIVPSELLEVWPEEEITRQLDQKSRPALAAQVSAADRKKLLQWNAVEQLDRNAALNVLQSKHLPKPGTWSRLLTLWKYVAPAVTAYVAHTNKQRLCIVPIQGKDTLYCPAEVVRLGEKKLLQSDEDWDFLSKHLLVLNQNWPRYLAEQRRLAADDEHATGKENIEAAFAVLKSLGLDESSDVNKVLERVATEFFAQHSVDLTDCIRLTQIAAKLGATVGKEFRFATQDRHLRPPESVIVFDRDGMLEELLPELWSSEHLLHQDYSSSFVSCTPEEWLRWISSGRAGVHAFPPFVRKASHLWGRETLQLELLRRGCRQSPFYPYVTSSFWIEDWDFEAAHWSHWTALAANDPHFWNRLIERIFDQPEEFWSKASSAHAFQVATTGTSRQIIYEPLAPTWALRFKDLECLPDTRGLLHKPPDLLLRSPQTEPFMDVEPFVHGRLDREKVRPLLALLGVRDVPMNPSRLLDCLRTLAQAKSPPVHEVEKWYRRLDQMLDTCSTADLGVVKNAFADEKIIFTEGGTWTAAAGVFLSSDEEDVPGAEVIRSSVRELALWRKLEIAERPTVELAVRWLKQLPSGEALAQNELRRVRALLARHPARIWGDCGHWLNLVGKWVPTSTLSYALTMQTLVPWSHLYQAVKEMTGDLQRLSNEIVEAPPFSEVPRLASRIEERLSRSLLLTQKPAKRAWLNHFGAELQRIRLEDETETLHVRTLAAKLADTVWQTAPGLEIIPYIDGAPAGTPRSAEVIWVEKILYVEDRPPAKLARAISQELGRSFDRSEIADAIKFCFERPTEFITEYLEESFKLIPRQSGPAVPDETEGPIGDTRNGDSLTPDSQEEAIPPSDEKAEANAGNESHEEAMGSDDGSSAEQSADGGSEQAAPEDVDDDTAPKKDSSSDRAPRVTLMECFARMRGFRKDNGERFFHSDGSWMEKPARSPFWEWRAANGELKRRFWAREHCLEIEPLQIDADVWGLIDKFPNLYALVLLDQQGEPIETSGSRLCSMRDGGQITLYPASYRLVYSDGRER